MEQLHLNLDNIHCRDCEEKVRTTFNKYIKTIRLNKKWTGQDDIPHKNDNTVYIYITCGEVDLYHKQLDGSLESIIRDSLDRTTKHLSKTGFDVLSWEFYTNGELELTSENGQSHSVGNDDIDINANNWFYDVFDIWSKYKGHRQIGNHKVLYQMFRREKLEK